MESRPQINTDKSSPLTAKQKLACIEALKQTNPQQLLSAIRMAALPPLLHTFPEPLQGKLKLMQDACRQHADDPDVLSPLAMAINNYINKNGLTIFQEILQGTMVDSSWNSDFLYFLMAQLNIQVEHAPLVQMMIQDGKVYWRVMIGDIVAHDRPAIKNWQVTFTKDNSWLIDWKLFREFKDSGKRYSPVEITLERFTNYFAPQCQQMAAQIWHELKAIGILTQKNRLSHGWRALSNKTVIIQAVEAVKLGSITATDKAKTGWYNLINNALYHIANHIEYAEKIAAVPGAIIFRPERTRKSWSGHALIKQAECKSELHCSKRWDVSVHQELDSFRNSVFEKNNYGGVILHYDHSPASSTLANSPTEAKQQLDMQIQQIDAELKTNEQQGYPKQAYDLRHPSNPLTPYDIACNKRVSELQAQRASLNSRFTEETTDLALCVAIPKALHKQSETTMASRQEQLARHGNPVHADISEHLFRLKKDPANFSIHYFDDYLHALGAFRFLFRRACKPIAAPLATQLPIARIAHGFFTQTKDRQELDTLLRNEMNEFLDARERRKK